MEHPTTFRYDVLATLARIGPAHGLAIKHALEAEDYENVNHGRMYPNLDRLVDAGLIDKGTIDKRTNEYALTEAGRRELQARIEELAPEREAHA